MLDVGFNGWIEDEMDCKINPKRKSHPSIHKIKFTTKNK